MKKILPSRLDSVKDTKIIAKIAEVDKSSKLIIMTEKWILHTDSESACLIKESINSFHS